MLLDLSPLMLLAAATALFAGGLSKGVLGVGLPMIALPLLYTSVPIREGVALMYGPVLIMNVWQTFQGGYFLMALRKFWPMMVAVVAGTWLGAKTLVGIDSQTLQVIVGITVAGFSLVNLLQPKLSVPARHALWLSIVVGLIGGFFGGLTLFIGPAVIMFLVALRTQKDEFIGIIALVYLLGIIPTGIIYAAEGVLRAEHIVPTLLACVPVFVGMLAGQWIRGRINEETFRKVLLIALVLIGLNMVRQGLF
ncbi:MAG TPA: sulfite exporter TauE/SafE family protein [Alphaproteobacteria bacterium]|nr:sulfite exporter TauE/SafE family protein [Alphaproteobacteria bacterium]